MKELIYEIHSRLIALGQESSEPSVEGRIGDLALAAVRADKPVSVSDIYAEFGLGS